MDSNQITSNLMDISDQQIKIEPSDKIKVELVNISELFMNERSNSKKCEPVTKILRDDAGPDEIVKEEPRFNDEFEIQETAQQSRENDEPSSKHTNYSMEVYNRRRFNSSVQFADLAMKNANLMPSNDTKTKRYENHHRNKTTSLVEVPSRQHRANAKRSQNPLTPKSTSKMKRLEHPTFECFLCKVRIGSASNLKRHYDRFHGEKMFCCNMCPKRYPVKFSLDIHQRSHTGVKPFSCKICQRKFATQNNLRRHNESCWPMDVAQSQPAVARCVDVSQRFQCYLCKFDANLNAIQELQVHMIKHTGDNVVLPCNVCRRIYSTQSALAQHMLGHTKHKPHLCETCSMRFTTKRNLKRHKRLHTRIGLFKCSRCSKEYTTKFARDTHQKKHGTK